MNENCFRSPLQPSPHDWTVEQVEQAATWLLERIPKEVPNPWELAAKKAIPFLDARRTACLAAMEDEKRLAATVHRIRKEAAAQVDPSQPSLPFKKAVCKIVKRSRWDRALPFYKKFLHRHPQRFDNYFAAIPAGGHNEFLVRERNKKNLVVYVQRYLDAHIKGELTGEEISLQRRQFLEVEGEIRSEIQRANANGRKKS